MTIHLRPEIEELILQDIQTGAYASIEDYVEQAVSMLHAQEAWLTQHREEISSAIDEGYAAAQRGELIDASKVQSNMKKRKEAFLAEKRGA
jgi:Arc/MetJ-type ribon-helix-helix transcriptional regulator